MTPARNPARFCQVSSNQRDLGEARASSGRVYNVRVESSLLHGLKRDAESVFQVEVMRRTGVVQ
jgi:hypothetical protein